MFKAGKGRDGARDSASNGAAALRFAGSYLREALYYARMAGYFASYVRMPLLADPAAALRSNLERREDNFLGLVRTGVFSNPETPYYELMRMAGCTFEDLRGSIGK